MEPEAVNPLIISKLYCKVTKNFCIQRQKLADTVLVVYYVKRFGSIPFVSDNQDKNELSK